MAISHYARTHVSSDDDDDQTFSHNLYSEMCASCYECEIFYSYFPGKKTKNKHINITFIIRGMGFKSLLIITLIN